MSLLATISNPIIRWLKAEQGPRPTPQCDYERLRYELKPCDIVLVEGRSRVSEIIKTITQSPWSHAALYIGRLHDIEDIGLRESLAKASNASPNDQLIIESELGMGTVARPLSSYKGEHMRICRPNGLHFQDAQRVIHYAISRLGIAYDIRQILDLARFLLPWGVLPKRWRSSLFNYSPGQSTRTVCSTMIAEAFGFVQFPILPLVKVGEGKSVQLFRRNPKLCLPRDFDYSPYFRIIKYPFMDYSHHTDYQLLPWHGQSALSQDEVGIYMTPDQLDQFGHPAPTECEAEIPLTPAEPMDINRELDQPEAPDIEAEEEPSTGKKTNKKDHLRLLKKAKKNE